MGLRRQNGYAGGLLIGGKDAPKMSMTNLIPEGEAPRTRAFLTLESYTAEYVH